MNVCATGIDIIETARIAASIERFGDRFLQRIFLPGELEYCNAMKFPARHLAARFAAKEAVSKAFGTGIGASVGWKDIEIRRKASGQPYCVLHGNAASLAKRLGLTEILVSLSHTDTLAAASATALG